MPGAAGLLPCSLHLGTRSVVLGNFGASPSIPRKLSFCSQGVRAVCGARNTGVCKVFKSNIELMGKQVWRRAKGGVCPRLLSRMLV